MKKLIALIFALTALLCISARAETVGGKCGENGGPNVKWELCTETGELRIYGEGLMADYISGYHPRAPWLVYSSAVKSLTVEEGVTSVGVGAFKGLEKLETVSLPSTVSAIKTDAFSNTAITSIDIPEASYIGSMAFSDCSELKSISLPQNLTEISYSLFSGSGLEEISVPSNITTIGDDAFRECKSLRKITLPEGIAQIGCYAFYECTSLTSVKWPSSAKSVPFAAFSGCTSLTEVELPEGVEIIESGAFYDCAALSRLTLPGTLKRIGEEGVWNGAFRGCKALTDVDFPDGLTYIGAESFRDTGLTSLTLPDSLTVADYGAFTDCRSLRSVTLSRGMTEIRSNLFAGCYSLYKINLSDMDNITSIGGSAFSGCSILTELTVPKNVSELNGISFEGMTALTYVHVHPENKSFYEIDGVLFSHEGPTLIIYPRGRTDGEYAIPEGVTSISVLSFWNHDYLRRLVFPSTLSDLRADDFRDAYALSEFAVAENNPYYSSVNGVLFNKDKTVLVKYPAGRPDEEYAVPYGVTEIGEHAFEGGRSVKKITLPESVTTLGLWTFRRCAKLESVNIPSGVTELPQNMLTDCPRFTRFAVPDNVTSLNSMAFGYDLVNLRFPENITELDWNWNLGCRTLILPDNIESIGVYHDQVLLCRAGSATEALLRALSEYLYSPIYYLPSIIGPGEEPSVVGSITADREAEINGVTIPLWRINYSLYASESDLARCGYTFSWDPESRTTTITPPEAAEWTVYETEPKSTATSDIWSSDVKFVLNGFVIPSINIGNGESVLDINAVAERRVY